MNLISTVKTNKREAVIEAAAVKAAVAKGWYCRKLKSTVRGIPDRIFAKDGRVIFVEFKSRIGVLSDIQVYEIDKMRQAGLRVEVCRSVEDLEKVLSES